MAARARAVVRRCIADPDPEVRTAAGYAACNNENFKNDEILTALRDRSAVEENEDVKSVLAEAMREVQKAVRRSKKD